MHLPLSWQATVDMTAVIVARNPGFIYRAQYDHLCYFVDREPRDIVAHVFNAANIWQLHGAEVLYDARGPLAYVAMEYWQVPYMFSPQALAFLANMQRWQDLTTATWRDCLAASRDGVNPFGPDGRRYADAFRVQMLGGETADEVRALLAHA